MVYVRDDGNVSDSGVAHMSARQFARATQAIPVETSRGVPVTDEKLSHPLIPGPHLPLMIRDGGEAYEPFCFGIPSRRKRRSTIGNLRCRHHWRRRYRRLFVPPAQTKGLSRPSCRQS
jgi:hypothetical protein